MKSFFLAILAATALPVAVWAQNDAQVDAALMFGRPVNWVGGQAPVEADTSALLASIGPTRSLSILDAVEGFLTANPNSAWAPALDANLAVAYREQGRYTRALEHWEEAWDAVKDDESPGGRQVREFVLGNWPQLLSVLGRRERLEQIATENRGRRIFNRQHQIAFNRAMEATATMERNPELSFRCGPLALWNVTKALGLTNAASSAPRTQERGGHVKRATDLVTWSSPTNGFAMSELVTASDRLGLKLVAAQRPAGGEIVAPAVLHWKQNHYAAILAHTNGACLVADPTFAEPQHWVPDSVIEEESSGYFMVPSNAVPEGWTKLAKQDVSGVRGQGMSNNINDGKDKKRPPCPTCGGGMPYWWVSEPYVNLWMTDQPVGWATSEGLEMGFKLNYKQREARSYPTYNAVTGLQPMTWNNNWLSWMEISDSTDSSWTVPGNCTYINTSYPMLVNDPMAGSTLTCTACMAGPPASPTGYPYELCGSKYYYTSTTVPINTPLSVSYIMNGTQTASCLPASSYCWAQEYASVIVGDPPTLFQTPANISAAVQLAEGGTIIAPYFSQGTGLITWTDNETKVQVVITNTAALPNRVTGATVIYPDGSQDRYTLVVRRPTIQATGAPLFKALLYRTSYADPTGHVTTFNFTTTLPTGNAFPRLASVTDPDGRTATLTYDPTYPNEITQVTDPYGRTASMIYNSNGELTQITDAVGMSSTVAYGTTPENGQYGITSLTTPYGQTTFTLTEYSANDGFSGNVNGGNQPNRSVLAQEPEGAVQLTAFCTYMDTSAGQFPQLAYMTPSPTSGGFSSSLQPVVSPWITGATFDFGADADTGDSNSNDDALHAATAARNSFHWGRKQAASLSTTVAANLTGADYAHARIRHWLADADFHTTTEVLSHQMDPSPDGVQVGGITWYDYPGKTAHLLSVVGTDFLPSIVARRIPNGPTTFLQYQRNTFGLPTTITSSYTKTDGTVGTRASTINYVNNVYVSTVSLPEGGTEVTLGYDTMNHVTSITDALGQVTQANYDPSTHKLTSIVYPATGLNIQLTWPSGQNSFPSQVTAVQMSGSTVVARFWTNSFTWQNGQPLTITDPFGLTRTFTYDNLDRPTLTTYPDTTTEAITYTKLDVTKIIDRMGYSKQYGYNGLGQLTSYTDPLNNITAFNRCSCGLLDSIVTPLGQTTSFKYDNRANLLRRIPAESDPVNFTYDVYGRMTGASDGMTAYTLTYNNQGQVNGIANGLGNLWTGVYDIDDRIATSTDRNGIVSTRTYDSLGRLRTLTWPDTGVQTLSYTAGFVSPTTYIDQVGHTQTFTYDPLQRLLSKSVPGVFTNNYTYTGAALTQLTDGNGHNTYWSYDSYGRPATKTNNNGVVAWTLGYYANGWLQSKATPAKGSTTYNYDAAGNLKGVTYPASPAITYGYDTLNRLNSMTDAAGTTGFGYNNFGALSYEDGPWASDTIGYTYTGNRRRAGYNLQQPSGSWNQSYGYDAASRMITNMSPAGSFVYSYLSSVVNASLVQKLTLPNGGYIQNGFDSVGRKSSTALYAPASAGGGILNSHSYLYDLAGKPYTRTDTAGNKWTYGYDGANELTSAVGQESGGASRLQEQFGYGYDAGGNLTNRTANALSQALSVDGMNQLTGFVSTGTLTVAGKVATTVASPASTVTVNGSSATVYADNTFAKSGMSFSTGPNTYTAVATQSSSTATTTSTINIPSSEPFGYDLDGNMVSDGLRYFDYDDQDQLIRVGNGVKYKSEFTYDGLQRRRIAKDYTCSVASVAMITAGTLGAVTNTYSGWVGAQIAVGSGAILVTDLSRWIVSGNTGSHVVKLVIALTGADVPGGSVTINTLGAAAGQYAYATLPAPVLLQPNTTYYILSQESSGSDQWYSATTALTPASGVTIPGGVWGTGYPYTTVANANAGFVPVGFKGVASSAMVSVNTLSGTIFNNYSGWLGTEIQVGSSPLVVTDLGRWVRTGNTGTHTVKLVRAVDSVDVPGGSVSVNTSGATAGQYKYATLASPVVLEAGTKYFLLSQETSGGDTWCNGDTTLTGASGISVVVPVQGTGAPYPLGNSANSSYVPVGLKASSATWNVAKETRYVYDYKLVVQERDGNNNPTVSYTRGKDLSGSLQGAGGIGGLLAYTSTSAGDHYYHSDALGNVTAMMNFGGSLSASYEYDPYGNLQAWGGAMAAVNNYRFSSKELHQNSGLYAYGYRFYEAGFQRWLNRDPIGTRGGINLYSFVQNEATRLVDKLGLSPEEDLEREAEWDQYFKEQLARLSEEIEMHRMGIRPTHHETDPEGKEELWAAEPEVPEEQGPQPTPPPNPAALLILNQNAPPAPSGQNAPPSPSLTITPCPEAAPKPSLFETSLLRPKSSQLSCRVTAALPPGSGRTPEENSQARNFFERNRDYARAWWSDRNGGEPWPRESTHDEHPRPLKDGGDPLYIEPGYGGPNAPHMIPGPDGRTDFQRWGALGGRPLTQ